MGMFDSLFVVCPWCKETAELQSKSGECILGRYTILDVPLNVLYGLDRPETCEHCHQMICINWSKCETCNGNGIKAVSVQAVPALRRFLDE